VQLKPVNWKPRVVGWLLLVAAASLHIFDEAITGFLPFYNELVPTIEERLGFTWLPTFAFTSWIAGLGTLILICLLLTMLVRRGGRTIRVICTAFGILMVLNALGHMLGSVYFGALLPGFWSSPLLLLAAMNVVGRGLKGDWTN
jgi:hypothetical protein